MFGMMSWYTREDSSKGTANPTVITNPAVFVLGASKVPTGSKMFAMLSIRRASKLENTTMPTAFASFSRQDLIWVTANKEMIAKVPVPPMGSRINPRKASTNRGPAAIATYARKQPVLSRLALAVTVPGTV